MKTFKKILLAVLAVLPAIYTAVAVFFFMPDTVPAHYGANGMVDRYGSKYEAFIFPGIILLAGIVYFFIRKILKKSAKNQNERAARNLDTIDTVMLLSMVLLNALCVFTLILMLTGPESIFNAEALAVIIVSAVVGVVFIIIGNILPKSKRNSFMGIRMKFTMDTDEHWYIANRAGGIALMISGLLTIAAGLIFRNITYVFVMVAALLITLTVATVYSYVIIKKEKSSSAE